LTRPKLLLRPTILDRYLLKEVASPFLIGLTLFTFVLLSAHLAEISDLLVGKSATWAVIGKLIFNILPSFLALTIPMACLLAVLLGLGRLASESELIAMQAVGVSPLFLLRGLLGLGALASGATYYVHAFWVPDANQEYRETAFSLAISRAQGVKPRVFIEDLLPHQSLYITDVELGTGAWRDILIIDRKDPGRPRVSLARRGELSINRAEKRVELELEQGAAYSFDLVERKTYDIQSFAKGRFPIDFGQIFPNLPLSRGDREMTPSMLLKEIARFEKEGNAAEAARYAVEYHKKYALSVVPLVFAVVGLALMLGGRRDSKQSAFGLAIAVIFVYYILARLGEQAGDTRALSPAIAVWAANLILGALAAYLLARARREGSVGPVDLGRLKAWIAARLSARENAGSRRGASAGGHIVGVLDRYIGHSGPPGPAPSHRIHGPARRRAAEPREGGGPAQLLRLQHALLPVQPDLPDGGADRHPRNLRNHGPPERDHGDEGDGDQHLPGRRPGSRAGGRGLGRHVRGQRHRYAPVSPPRAEPPRCHQGPAGPLELSPRSPNGAWL
jgi:lipopolysaccharide export system permease protein